MREATLWKWLKGAEELLTTLHMTRVEDSLGEGRPDVEGWWRGGFVIELKVAPRPARPTTNIRAQHPPTVQQIEWLKARRNAGGSAYILVQVGEGPAARRYLLDGDLAAEVLAGRPEDWYAAHAVREGTTAAAELVASASMGRGLPSI